MNKTVEIYYMDGSISIKKYSCIRETNAYVELYKTEGDWTQMFLRLRKMDLRKLVFPDNEPNEAKKELYAPKNDDKKSLDMDTNISYNLISI